MAKVDWKKGLYSLNARGKFGLPNGFGLIKFGWSKFGDSNLKSGYYQRHWNGIKYHWVKARHYWNPPHTTETALAWKAVFANGVIAWKALDENQKRAYNQQRYPTAQSGFTRFMSKYLKEHA